MNTKEAKSLATMMLMIIILIGFASVTLLYHIKEVGKGVVACDAVVVYGDGTEVCEVIMGQRQMAQPLRA